NDTVLHYRFETNMKALTPNAGTGTWTKVSGSGTINDLNSPTSLISDLKFGESKFLWTVVNGSCSVTSDTITLTIKDIKSPKGFSPNNDGKNDKFVILGLDNSKSNELTVFNRSGVEIFKADNYQNDWDGTDHWGKPVPEDTYYYVLKVDEKFSYSGYVVIKR
ncbi:MAG: gliding motility-associated C-terminal domain-containing protein, partial [Bacteroidota bacterium]|nr:gliding motility-associated C-terminal domain-containing protein [Bacteroidota bacterium]